MHCAFLLRLHFIPLRNISLEQGLQLATRQLKKGPRKRKARWTVEIRKQIMKTIRQNEAQIKFFVSSVFILLRQYFARDLQQIELYWTSAMFVYFSESSRDRIKWPKCKKKGTLDVFMHTATLVYYTQKRPTKPQNRWWCLPAPSLLNIKRWCLYCIATPLSSSKKLQWDSNLTFLVCLVMLTLASWIFLCQLKFKSQ